MKLVRRLPSELGEFETGCFYQASNNMALSATCDSVWYDAAMLLCAAWNEAARVAVRMAAALPVTPDEHMLGWLLERGEHLLTKAFELSEERRITDNDRRDWFCWCHRWMYEQAQEHYRHEK